MHDELDDMFAEEEEEDWADVEEQLNVRHGSAAAAPAPAATSARPAKQHSSRLSSGASTPSPSPAPSSATPRRGKARSSSKLLPPPPSSGYASPSYTPGAHTPTASAFHPALIPSDLMPTPTVRYRGMDTARSEFLLPTRVSVSDRTTTTVAAKVGPKHPKSDRSYHAYIPDNQVAPFVSTLPKPKPLDSTLPPPPLPGQKSAQWTSGEFASTKTPVAESSTRAMAERSTTKSARASKGLTPALLDSQLLLKRKSDRRRRFEEETERAKETLWQAASISERAGMVQEERARVEALVRKVRAARTERESAFRQAERLTRQKENAALRPLEQSLRAYESRLREDERTRAREEYTARTGEDPPEDYALPSLDGGTQGGLEKFFSEADEFAPGVAVASAPASMYYSSLVRARAAWSSSSAGSGGGFGSPFAGTVVSRPSALSSAASTQFPMVSSSDPAASESLLLLDALDEEASSPQWAGSSVASPMGSPLAATSSNPLWINPLPSPSPTAASAAGASSATSTAVSAGASPTATAGSTAPASPAPTVSAHLTPRTIEVHDLEERKEAFSQSSPTPQRREQGAVESTAALLPSTPPASSAAPAPVPTPLVTEAVDPLDALASNPLTPSARRGGVGYTDSGKAIRSASPPRGHAPTANEPLPDSPATVGVRAEPPVSPVRREPSVPLQEEKEPPPARAASSPVSLSPARVSTPTESVLRATTRSNGHSVGGALDRPASAIKLMAPVPPVPFHPAHSRGLSVDVNAGPAVHQRQKSNSVAVAGNAVEWAADEKKLAAGITVIKFPRNLGLFSGPKEVTLFVTHGSFGSTQGKWLLHWNSSTKAGEEDFINLSEMKAFYTGIKHGVFKSNRDIGRKYAEQSHQCFTLNIPARKLDLVVRSADDTILLKRVLQRILTPGGQHRTPRVLTAENPERNGTLSH